MPHPSDVDFAELERLRPDLVLVDVVPDARRFVYRYVGSRDVEQRGRDPTGLSVAEGYFGPSREEVLDNYEAVVESGSPHIDVGLFNTPDGRVDNSEVIFLPLSADGAAVSQVLVYTRFLQPPGGAP